MFKFFNLKLINEKYGNRLWYIMVKMQKERTFMQNAYWVQPFISEDTRAPVPETVLQKQVLPIRLLGLVINS